MFVPILVMFASSSSAQLSSTDDNRGVPTIAPIVQAVTGAVVNISVVSEQPLQMSSLFNDPFFRDLLDAPELAERQPHLNASHPARIRQ